MEDWPAELAHSPAELGHTQRHKDKDTKTTHTTSWSWSSWLLVLG